MMADKLPFRAQASEVANDPQPIGALPPYREFTQGGAAAGMLPSEAELPVHAGQVTIMDGFSPSSETKPLPPPGSSDGFPLPPSGYRR